MATFLRVMIVFMFLLTGGVLTMGIMLFSDRELLKGRILRLEEGIIAVGTTIEDGPPTEEDGVEHWIESQGNETYVVDGNVLKKYFVLDPIALQEGKQKPFVDPATGLKVTKGEDTTDQELLDLLAAGSAQLDRLESTRQKLTDTRLELEDTIEKLRLMTEDRDRLQQELNEARSEIDRLNEVIRQKDDEIASLKRIIEDKEAEIKEKMEEIVIIKDELADQELKNKQLIDENERLRGILISRPDAPKILEPGKKGVIERVQTELRFVVFRYDSQDEGIEPGVELVVKRVNRPIGKIRVTRLLDGKPYAIAEILNIWRGQEILRGDEVIF